MLNPRRQETGYAGHQPGQNAKTHFTPPPICPALKLPALPMIQTRLSSYPEPKEASGGGFCRQDLDKGQMLTLGKEQ